MPLKLIRFWVPLTLVVVGLGLVLAGGASESAFETGIPIFSAGLSVWLLNFLYRVGVSGDVERDHERDARQFFAEHGRWPAEDGDAHLAGGGR